MKQLEVLLFNLKNKPHCILPQYANALTHTIEKYLDTMPEGDMSNEDMPMGSNVKNGISIININGIIAKRLGVPQTILDLFGIVDLDNIDSQLIAARDNPEVTAIVLDVTSPGGFITGVQSTAELLADISKIKETAVYSDVLNASAAYFISSQANTILNSVDAEIGSIGVYTTIEDWSKAYEMMGVKVNLIKAGKWKAIGEPSQPLTDEQKAFLQEEVNNTWGTFKSYVTRSRNIKEEDLQGQTFSGLVAVEKNLSDGIANNIQEVISALSSKE